VYRSSIDKCNEQSGCQGKYLGRQEDDGPRRAPCGVFEDHLVVLVAVVEIARCGSLHLSKVGAAHLRRLKQLEPMCWKVRAQAPLVLWPLQQPTRRTGRDSLACPVSASHGPIRCLAWAHMGTRAADLPPKRLSSRLAQQREPRMVATDYAMGPPELEPGTNRL
jgi:hypothetical protein